MALDLWLAMSRELGLSWAEVSRLKLPVLLDRTSPTEWIRSKWWLGRDKGDFRCLCSQAWAKMRSCSEEAFPGYLLLVTSSWIVQRWSCWLQTGSACFCSSFRLYSSRYSRYFVPSIVHFSGVGCSNCWAYRREAGEGSTNHFCSFRLSRHAKS